MSQRVIMLLHSGWELLRDSRFSSRKEGEPLMATFEVCYGYMLKADVHYDVLELRILWVGLTRPVEMSRVRLLSVY